MSSSRAFVYLDHAATSFPKPPEVYEQLAGCLHRCAASPGRGGYALARQARAVVEETRDLLAALFHVNAPSRIAFTLNATDALNMAIKGVLSPGDHVVTTMVEHNSVARPLASLERRGLIEVSRIAPSPEGYVNPEDVRRAITPRTKLVIVIHASNVHGAVQPIAEIGGITRLANRLLLVDASQTAGRYPIDVEGSCIDLLAFPGHKALLGPPGTGGLYAGPRVDIRPWREGGTGVLSELPLQPEIFPLRLEAGSPNTWGIALLGAAVEFILERGVEEIRAQELRLMERLLDRVTGDPRLQLFGPAGVSQRVAVASVRVFDRSPVSVAEWLDQQHHIAVRAGLHCAPGAHRALGTYPAGTVRISAGYGNALQDIDRCVAALSDAVHRAEDVQPSAAAAPVEVT